MSTPERLADHRLARKGLLIMAESSSSSAPGPLPIRWAVILVAAGVISLLIGALTYVQTHNWPASLLAAAGAAGSAVPVLHQVLGK
jgi:hypothetical protein